MIAADTNVLVRLITADHDEQSPRVRALFDQHRVWISLTVVLETEWLLRSSRGLDRASISLALRAVTGLPNVVVEQADRIAQALAWLDAGMDFADALHLAAAGDCEGFATFDRQLAVTAERLGSAVPVREP